MTGTIISILCSMLVQEFQDFTLKTRRTDKGHAYMEEKMPGGIMLNKISGGNYELQVESPTLIQVWSVCCGGDAGQWADQRYTETLYTPRGLRVISINFENGKSAKEQLQLVKEYLESKPKPAEIYFDSMGYVMDNLPMIGFPTYILVNSKGVIFFRTSGNSAEGMALLTSEIENMLSGND